MGSEARVDDPESMKTWKKPHAVAGMVLVVTLVATGALIAAANRGDGAAALTGKRRSQLTVARAETSRPAGGGARPTFEGERHQTDPPPSTTSTSTTSTSTTSTTIDDRRPLACRNSTNPQCGPFRWDPQPLPNRPMRVDVPWWRPTRTLRARGSV
jgi:hypothetical protein